MKYFPNLQEPDEGQKLREQHLRHYAFFQLKIHLKRGQALIAMDKNGTSKHHSPTLSASTHSLTLSQLARLVEIWSNARSNNLLEEYERISYKNMEQFHTRIVKKLDYSLNEQIVFRNR